MIEPKYLELNNSDDLAKIIINYYGYSVNNSFLIYEIEDWTESPVSAASIIKVHDKDIFFEENSYYTTFLYQS